VLTTNQFGIGKNCSGTPNHHGVGKQQRSSPELAGVIDSFVVNK